MAQKKSGGQGHGRRVGVCSRGPQTKSAKLKRFCSSWTKICTVTSSQCWIIQKKLWNKFW